MAALGAAAAWKGLAIVVALALVSGWAWAGAALLGIQAAAGIVAVVWGACANPPGLLTACLASESASYVGGFTPIGRGCSGRVSPCAGSISH